MLFAESEFAAERAGRALKLSTYNRIEAFDFVTWITASRSEWTSSA